MSTFLSLHEARHLLAHGARVLDVRSVGEFESGHAPDSLHLPLHLLPLLAKERLPANCPLLVCCVSGARSHLAVELLRAMGFDAENLGPWTFHPELT